VDTHFLCGERRSFAYGIFTAGYGISWLPGSAVIGVLYGFSSAAAAWFSVGAELAALPFFLKAAHAREPGG
jgi:hypothetical protein